MTLKRFQSGWTRSGGHPPRDRFYQPFFSDSIWNTPIGSGATFGASDLAPATLRQPLGYPEITSDPENIGMSINDPLKGLSGGLPNTITDQQVHIPATLTANGSFNNCTALLGADGRTIFQGQPLTLTAGGNGTMTYTNASADIFSHGMYGSHGGSGLSGVGGSIRSGELTSIEPIRHALKINVYGVRFLSQAGGGYMWPATKADTGYDNSGSANFYGGSNTLMRMGTLLAIPGTTDLTWIRSNRVKKMAICLRDYGAYIVDNTARNVHAFAAEKGAFPEMPNSADQQFHTDLMALITMLRIVTNNSSTNIGGGGTPRVPNSAPIFT